MTTFSELCVKHNCDKGILPDGVGHGYDRHYGAILEPLRHLPIRLLEIGVGDGKSIRIWLDYFTHPAFRVIGVDNGGVAQSQGKFTFVQGDQSNPHFWQEFLVQHGGGFDVVIDDGSHLTNGIITSFEALWPFVKSGGCYVIEDLRCSYMGSGYQVPGWCSQMDFIKQLLDDINAQTNYKPSPDATFTYPRGTDGGRGIEWMQFTPELCILKKK